MLYAYKWTYYGPKCVMLPQTVFDKRKNEVCAKRIYSDFTIKSQVSWWRGD